MELAKQGTQATRGQAADAGAALFKALMGREARLLFERACRSAWKNGETLRLALKVDAEGLPSWIHAPWRELLYGPERAVCIASDPDVRLVRYLRQPNPVGRLPAGSTCRTPGYLRLPG